MDDMTKTVPIVIPSYEPDERLITLLEDLNKAGIGPVIIVNDGSGPEYDEIFEKAAGLIEAGGGKFISYRPNRGKGRALKTAFEYIAGNMPDALGCVTADSDGQHTPECIASIIKTLKENPESLILGVRKFDGEDIPWKSRFGNNLTIKVFAYVSGVKVSDTQTGLRGIPFVFMKELIDCKGERFEYETRMLLECAGRYKITEVPIKTVYDSKENHQTHFDPFKDSTQSGTIHRLRGKGLPSVNSYGTGDLYVKILVWIPRKLRGSDKEAVEKLAASNAVKPDPSRDDKALFEKESQYF